MLIIVALTLVNVYTTSFLSGTCQSKLLSQRKVNLKEVGNLAGDLRRQLVKETELLKKVNGLQESQAALKHMSEKQLQQIGELELEVSKLKHLLMTCTDSLVACKVPSSIGSVDGHDDTESNGGQPQNDDTRSTRSDNGGDSSILGRSSGVYDSSASAYHGADKNEPSGGRDGEADGGNSAPFGNSRRNPTFGGGNHPDDLSDPDPDDDDDEDDELLPNNSHNIGGKGEGYSNRDASRSSYSNTYSGVSSAASSGGRTDYHHMSGGDDVFGKYDRSNSGGSRNGSPSSAGGPRGDRERIGGDDEDADGYVVPRSRRDTYDSNPVDSTDSRRPNNGFTDNLVSPLQEISRNLTATRPETHRDSDESEISPEEKRVEDAQEKVRDFETKRDDEDDVNATDKEAAPLGIAVVVMCGTDVEDLDATVQSIIKYQTTDFPLFVSQDGDDKAVSAAIRRLKSAHKIHHIRFGVDVEDLEQDPDWDPEQIANFQATHHLQWMLDRMFDYLAYEKVIVVQSGMVISPDFFQYFDATASLLDDDESILCVSAWNDNGITERVSNSSALYRTDTISGRGWMLTNTLWEEIRFKWPSSFWVDWIQLPENRKGRSCILPEVSRIAYHRPNSEEYGRTNTDTTSGSAVNQREWDIPLNMDPVQFVGNDLSYLLLKNYRSYMKSQISRATELDLEFALDKLSGLPDIKAHTEMQTFIIKYSSLTDFDGIAGPMGLSMQHQNGIPRSSFEGIVPFRFGTSSSSRQDGFKEKIDKNRHLVLLVPSEEVENAS